MNATSINVVSSRFIQRSVTTLVMLSVTLFASISAGQTPTPTPIAWPPPEGPVKVKVTSIIAQLIRDAVASEVLRGQIASCDGAKREVQKRLGLSLPLPDELVFVFYEQMPPYTTGSMSYPKNALYSIFYLPPNPADIPAVDILAFRKFLVCCYQPW